MKRGDQETRQENFLYLIIWTMIFAVVPVTRLFRWLSGHSTAFGWAEVFRAWTGVLPFLALFLIHNYLIAPLLIKRRRTPLYLVLTVLLLVSFGTFTILAHSAPGRPEREGPPPQALRHAPAPERMDRPAPPPEEFRHAPRPEPKDHRGNPPMSPETMKIIMGLLVIGVNLGAKFFFEGRRNERKMEQLRTEHLNHQLEYLRYQINPHFFMNTLNNIHALVDIDPEKAKESIEEFSKLMRYVLYDGDRPTIPLSRELEYLRHFISLMRIRFADSVRIKTDFPEETSDTQIPPLLLASFVENAFKHGISYDRDSFVEVCVSVTDGSISFLCNNSRQGEEQPLQHGIGLANVRKRLDLLYDGNYTLEIQEKPNTYSICLTLPAAPVNHP